MLSSYGKRMVQKAFLPDYRPISLIHAIAKIIAKVLSLRLAPHMDELVSNAQSAFIKGRSIHENFMYVRNFARRLHKRRTSALLLKLDIKKAFDSVKWGYFLEVLQWLGFPPKFRAWIAALLSTSSSRIMLNRVPGPPIKHGSGFRQGDPLSPSCLSLRLTLFIRYWTSPRGKGSS
uniref:Reverse transcriptase domain-containing protein n=1 Tax=Triticum urartu TaxID=4572 RepID=A0A8R7VIM3_TRIUA